MRKGRQVRGCIFDMDGTLTLPSINFAAMRQSLGVPQDEDVLGWVAKLDDDRRHKAEDIIHQFERGLIELFAYLKEEDLPCALLTRNSQDAIDHFLGLSNIKFRLALSRDFTPVKPKPDGVLHICKECNIDPQECLFVGDAKDDMLAGSAAGNTTVLLLNDKNEHLAEMADIVIKDLTELINIIKTSRTE